MFGRVEGGGNFRLAPGGRRTAAALGRGRIAGLVAATSARFLGACNGIRKTRCGDQVRRQDHCAEEPA